MHGIEQAKADVALLERLNGAADKLASLTTLQNSIVLEQRLIAERDVESRRIARFSRFTSIDVSDLHPAEHVMSSSFKVSWTSLTWDSRAHESLPTPTTQSGFSGLPQDVLEYLIERHPSKIPAKIANLAANPYDAFERYFIGMRRGHLIGNAYDTERKA